MTGIFTELRIAMRSLARAPGFTVVAVLTLALGIGATTAVFTLVDSVLLRPLPYPDSDRILSIQHEGRGGEDELPISSGLYVLYGEHARSLGAIAMHANSVVNFTGDGEAERVTGQAVTPSIHDVLGVRPALGRPFLAADGEPGAEPVVVLSHGLWQARFGGDPSVLEESVLMDGLSRRVVGIMPQGFAYPDEAARFWVPLIVDPGSAPLAAFGAAGIARMAPGQSVEGVHAELQGIIARLEDLAPEAAPTVTFLHDVNLTARVSTLKETMVGDLRRTMWTLLGMVFFVLLIACANVANLLLVRAEGRQRELALRQAVGAGRAALMKPFLAESLALGLAGGTLGVAIAAFAVNSTTALAPADLPRMAEVGIDPRVLAFAAAVSLLAAIAAGLFPVLRYGRGDLSGALKDGGARGGTTGRERHRVRSGLVVAQVTLALVLLVGSGLMFRSFLALLAVDPGFQRENVLAVQLSIPAGEVAEPIAVANLYRELRERLEAQPMVRAVGATTAVPLSGQLNFFTHTLEDHPTGPNELPPMAFLAYVDPGYFEAMGIRLVEGRTTGPQDGADGFRGVVVSRAYAQRWWPNESAIGRRLQFSAGPPWEIVGVVENVRNRGLQVDAEEIFYAPTLIGDPEQPQVLRTRELVVRVDGDPLALLPVLRREIGEINPNMPLANPRTMEDVMRASAAETSFALAVLGSASLVALLLGLIGIYGVVSYVVTQRTREIGVRMALGATGDSVRRLVVRQGIGVVALGICAGLVMALASSRVIESLLYGVGSRDPLTYAAVVGSLTAVALLASWIPAHRAAGVDPAVALRQD
jgi:putative ABC transport system permease protein